MAHQRGGVAVAYTKAGGRASAKYQKAHLDVFNVKVPKGELAEIDNHAAARSESRNGFVKRAIKETMARDNETPEE